MSQTTPQMPKIEFETYSTRQINLAEAHYWIPRQQEDPATVLERKLGDWIKEVGENESLFKKNVYENPELHDWDVRQHLARICALISSGESIAIGISVLREAAPGLSEQLNPIVALIDQKIKTLLDALIRWHGPLSVQSDIPESFKQATREVEEGNIVDLDI